jgi:hypothetical protein
MPAYAPLNEYHDVHIEEGAEHKEQLWQEFTGKIEPGFK